MSEIRPAVRGSKTVLDVGCGNSSPLRFLSAMRLVGVDGYPPAIEEAQKQGTHDEFRLGDIKRLPDLFDASSFDGCIALDVIEHLPKEDGWRLLDNMERLARRCVIILTPNGFVPQHSKNGDLQEHLSGWEAQEFRQRGYRVIGMGGLKKLRGEYHALKYKPRAFWALVSFLSQGLYTKNRPEKAAAILAIKKLA